jgi:hypothetical protein
MADDKSEATGAKWAAEAFAFVRFFQRVANQLWGLILLELGWALVLVLASKLTPQDSPPVLRLPWLTADRHLAMQDVPLTSVFPVGSLVVCGVWLVSSGSYVYISLSTRRALRRLAVVTGWIVFFALAAIQIPFELPLIARVRRRQPYGEVKKIVAVARQEEQRRASDTRQRRKQRRQQVYLREVSALLSADRPPVEPGPLLSIYRAVDRWGSRLAKRLANITSSGRIGLAPLYSYSFIEDEKAAKAPLQMFAGAVGQFRAHTRRLDAVRHMHFDVLPPIFKVTTERRARLIRKLLGLDALLWGSYLAGVPSRLWLNIEYAHPSSTDQREDDDADLFRNFFDVDAPVVVIDQDDLVDAYIVIAVTLLQALQARSQRRKPSLFPHTDKLYYSIGDRAAILRHLIRHALFAIDRLPESGEIYPTMKETFVRIVGRWVARQLAHAFGDEVVPLRFLEQVTTKCADLLPGEADPYYLVAAVQCRLGEQEAAAKAFDVANERARSVRSTTNPILLGVYATRAIDDLDHTYVDRDVRWMKAVVTANRTIAMTNGEERPTITDAFVKTSAYQIRTMPGERESSVSERLLYRALDLPFPENAASQAPETAA